MSPRHQSERLADISLAIAAIRSHLRYRDSMSMVVEDAIKYRLVEIGEAAGELTDDVKSIAPGIPWVKIKSMRNLLAHAYHDVDIRIVWAIIDEHIDALDLAVRQMLDTVGGADPDRVGPRE